MNTTTIILAGGIGSRLRPFTYSTPKPLLKIQGKPILQYVIENLHKHNLNDIILAVDYKEDKIEDYFSTGKKFGVNLTYCKKTGHIGTGGAIKFCAKDIKNKFIVIFGDNIANYDFTKMLKEHKKNKGIATLALNEVKDVTQFGVVKLKNKRIVKFVEKPKKEDAPSNLINSGAYVLEPKILKYIPEGKCSMEKDCFEKITIKEKIFGFMHKGVWFPTDNFERFFIANKKLDQNRFIK
jgi:mannose-1-phosphate guanylyltransferase